MKEQLLDGSKLYYLSHPYTSHGNREGNLRDANLVEMHIKIRHNAKVINPITLIPENTRDDIAMEKCFNMYQAADAIILCENWDKSTGCKIERKWAIRDGKDIYYFIKGKVCRPGVASMYE